MFRTLVLTAAIALSAGAPARAEAPFEPIPEEGGCASYVVYDDAGNIVEGPAVICEPYHLTVPMVAAN